MSASSVGSSTARSTEDSSSGMRSGDAGRDHGLVAGGYKAIDSCRLEKGYRVWGSDITPDDTPYEAGLGFAVKLDKGDFIGRDALAGREPGADSRASSSTTRGRSPSARSRSASTARRVGRASRAAATATPSSARSRTPTSRPLTPSRDARRRRDLRRVGRRRGRRRAAVRPGRVERIRSSTPFHRLPSGAE